jgi:hypothetical protein
MIAITLLRVKPRTSSAPTFIAGTIRTTLAWWRWWMETHDNTKVWHFAWQRSGTRKIYRVSGVSMFTINCDWQYYHEHRILFGSMNIRNTCHNMQNLNQHKKDESSFLIKH